MGSNHNLPGVNNGTSGGRLGVTGVPMEWLDAGSWRLPSGKALAEFALQAGFLAPLLFRSEALKPTGRTVADAARSRALRKGEPR